MVRMCYKINQKRGTIRITPDATRHLHKMMHLLPWRSEEDNPEGHTTNTLNCGVYVVLISSIGKTNSWIPQTSLAFPNRMQSHKPTAYQQSQAI
jgi:hypothetical protein